jgi:glycosyltransferase involved in cell wall biosynthesis
MRPNRASKLRVAYLINQYPKVSHSFIRREIQALERQGLDVLRIAVRGWDEPLADPADLAERARTHYLLQDGWTAPLFATLRAALTRPRDFLRAARLAWSMWRRSERTLAHHCAYLCEAAYLVQWLAEGDISHLHAHFGTNPAEVAMLAHVLGGPPFSFTVHGPEEFDRPEALALGEKGRRASFVVAISSFGRSQLYRWLPQAHWPKVQIVHCGLEREFYEDAPSRVSGEMRLVCVGRLCEQKGQLLLLRALGLVVSRGVLLDLVLAGDGELRSEIETLVDQLGLRDRVRITGWIGSHEVRHEILAARALVLPSFAEGLPVVIMEAMALRRPVITTFVAGIPELVRDGQDGWLVPAGDVDSLSRAIEACALTEPEALAHMGESARQRVLERHAVDIEAAKLASLFAGTIAAEADSRVAMRKVA